MRFDFDPPLAKYARLVAFFRNYTGRHGSELEQLLHAVADASKLELDAQHAELVDAIKEGRVE